MEIDQKLPNNAEEATKAYLSIYRERFFGSKQRDMFLLIKIAQDLFQRLKEVAPQFYEESYPRFLNQAATLLMALDPRRPEELRKFHEAHASLLVLTQDLVESPPTGEVDFFEEKKKLEEKASLHQMTHRMRRIRI